MYVYMSTFIGGTVCVFVLESPGVDQERLLGVLEGLAFEGCLSKKGSTFRIRCSKGEVHRADIGLRPRVSKKSLAIRSMHDLRMPKETVFENVPRLCPLRASA